MCLNADNDEFKISDGRRRIIGDQREIKNFINPDLSIKNLIIEIILFIIECFV